MYSIVPDATSFCSTLTADQIAVGINPRDLQEQSAQEADVIVWYYRRCIDVDQLEHRVHEACPADAGASSCICLKFLIQDGWNLVGVKGAGLKESFISHCITTRRERRAVRTCATDGS